MASTSGGLLNAKPGSNSQTSQMPYFSAIAAARQTFATRSNAGLYSLSGIEPSAAAESTPNGRTSDVEAHFNAALEQLELPPLVSGSDRIHGTEAGGITGYAQFTVGEKVCRICARIGGPVLVQRDVWREAADFDTVVAGIGMTRYCFFEGNWMIGVGAEREGSATHLFDNLICRLMFSAS